MKAKFEYLIEKHGYRVGEIAAKVGVDTPVISHLLKGRNKPNYVLTGKIIAAFPEFSALWWLGLSDDPNAQLPTGTSTMETKKPEMENLENRVVNSDNEKFSLKTPTLFDVPNFATPNRGSHSATQIERVIVIYSDQSFESFTPKK